MGQVGGGVKGEIQAEFSHAPDSPGWELRIFANAPGSPCSRGGSADFLDEATRIERMEAGPFFLLRDLDPP
jgi:hypothetical protein